MNEIVNFFKLKIIFHISYICYMLQIESLFNPFLIYSFFVLFLMRFRVKGDPCKIVYRKIKKNERRGVERREEKKRKESKRDSGICVCGYISICVRTYMYI